MFLPPKKKKRWVCEVMELLTNSTVVSTSQYISNHHLVYLKFIQCSMSIISQERGNKKNCPDGDSNSRVQFQINEKTTNWSLECRSKIEAFVLPKV